MVVVVGTIIYWASLIVWTNMMSWLNWFPGAIVLTGQLIQMIIIQVIINVLLTSFFYLLFRYFSTRFRLNLISAT